MKYLTILSIVCIALACNSNNDKVTEEKPQVALTKSVNSDAFNASFGKLMTDYFKLKDAFIAEKEADVDALAKALMTDADSLLLGELKADSAIVGTANTLAKSISGELKGLLGEKKLDEKRQSFRMLSEQLYTLINTVQYDREKVYHQYCPMAFNDEGAYWLSNSDKIQNPYLPKTMLICGEVKDSLGAIRKQ